MGLGHMEDDIMKGVISLLMALCWIGIALLMAGCSSDTGRQISSGAIQESQKLCANNGGLSSLTIKWSGFIYVSCNNGARFGPFEQRR